MHLIFRKLDERNFRDITQFNRLMTDLSQAAADQELLRQRIHEANRNPDKYLMVAEDADTRTLCGSVLGVCFGDFCDECKPVMVIENVVTHRDYRNRGVGRAMFEAIEQWGREKGAAYAILCSANHRTEAHKFYPAVGYDEIKGYKKYL